METERGRQRICDVAERTDDIDADGRCGTASSRARSVGAALESACGCRVGT